MNWYIADIHFGHKNMISFDNRPFSSVEEMDDVLITNWNSLVKHDDDVYILGDFCYRAEKTPAWYLKQLSGKKHLIIGNHDGELLRDDEVVEKLESIDKMLFVKDSGKNIVLCHFPIAEWNGFYRNAWHIYGHLHGQKSKTYEYMKTLPRALNAGCMLHGYAPASLEQLVKTCNQKNL